jgi:hypothetical protein
MFQSFDVAEVPAIDDVFPEHIEAAPIDHDIPPQPEHEISDEVDGLGTAPVVSIFLYTNSSSLNSPKYAELSRHFLISFL